MARTKTPSCSFCGKPADVVDQLIAGGARPNTFICDECLAVAAEIREEHSGPAPEGLASIGVRELRNQVAAVVRRAAAGERIVITVDGRPTAQLGPLTAVGAPTLADLAAAGLVEGPRTTRPTGAPTAEDLPVDIRLDRIVDDLRGH